ncbi:Inositol monophosphatase 2 [Taenia crassiceps]|uniref:inositol-phosphate phosphatase n=1 Tax=Taenia crassiceps TaxID=6207 RepID=A0ABR4QE41_9CEST
MQCCTLLLVIWGGWILPLTSRRITTKRYPSLTSLRTPINKLRTWLSLESSEHILIITEESASGRSILTSDPTWIVDPIDGTSNFVSKFPFCAVCIGFYKEKPSSLLFITQYAIKSSIRSRYVSLLELHNALILTDWGGDRNASNLDTKAANIRRLISEARGVRTMGSAALHMCQVAAGQGDVFFEFGIHCWDYAAASLIVTEAGGYCCNVDGGPVDLMARHCVAASSKQLAEVICQKIVPISYPRD